MNLSSIRVLVFIKRNYVGFSLGAGYSLLSFMIFFAGLGYGASCPELGPEVCDNPPFHVAFASSLFAFALAIPHMLSWSFVFYIAQGVTITLIPNFLDGTRDFGYAMVIVGIIISFLWAMIGAYIQRAIRNHGAADRIATEM